MSSAYNNLAQKIVIITETFLTRRVRRRSKILEKQEKRGMIVDWVLSFLWAAGVVLLLNQYLVQAYMIPSGSMIPSLIERDRIFVNKVVFGPEVLPGLGALSFPTKPKRYDVVIFESPDYMSRGTTFEILQRVLFMLTLSRVNINTDENGLPKVQFLIKRLIALPEDQIRLDYDGLYFKLKGTNNWISNAEFRALTKAEYPDNDPSHNNIQMTLLAKKYAEISYTEREIIAPRYANFYDMQRAIAIQEYALNPSSLTASYNYSVYKNGWYMAEDRYFFMGDNRDDSKDGRSYGGVPRRNILGKAMFIFYPVARIQSIQ